MSSVSPRVSCQSLDDVLREVKDETERTRQEQHERGAQRRTLGYDAPERLTVARAKDMAAAWKRRYRPRPDVPVAAVPRSLRSPGVVLKAWSTRRGPSYYPSSTLASGQRQPTSARRDIARAYLRGSTMGRAVASSVSEQLASNPPASPTRPSAGELPTAVLATELESYAARRAGRPVAVTPTSGSRPPTRPSSRTLSRPGSSACVGIAEATDAHIQRAAEAHRAALRSRRLARWGGGGGRAVSTSDTGAFITRSQPNLHVRSSAGTGRSPPQRDLASSLPPHSMLPLSGDDRARALPRPSTAPAPHSPAAMPVPAVATEPAAAASTTGDAEGRSVGDVGTPGSVSDVNLGKLGLSRSEQSVLLLARRSARRLRQLEAEVEMWKDMFTKEARGRLPELDVALQGELSAEEVEAKLGPMSPAAASDRIRMQVRLKRVEQEVASLKADASRHAAAADAASTPAAGSTPSASASAPGHSSAGFTTPASTPGGVRSRRFF